ncbi:hypothetical protein BGZ65_008784 [Modicella reniformis]|uniref:Cytochrome P450 n=1 Tax=Modicella reniformis TaxID=1440133 RepID=A0A9P6MKA6_9FUNG|nr:hypothetical protein BGZ65_008784 [Modicella reniformis]
MCYNLGKHPKVMECIREEIFQEVGRERKPDHEDIKKLKFLKQVINETLRLYPAVPFNDLHNGYFVPKGSVVVHSSYVTHRMKEYWGEDAEEFDPDRWGPERQDGKAMSDQSSPPVRHSPVLTARPTKGILKRPASQHQLDERAPRLKWDEESLAITEAQKDSTMKIDEPKTPFVYYNPDLDRTMDMDGKMTEQHTDAA